MRPNSRRVAFLIAGLTVAITLVLLIDRGGLVAWTASLLGIALLLKIWLRPSNLDPALSAGLALTTALVWAGTAFYVLATWESAEVVEIAVDTDSGAHTGRVWVLDIGAHPLVYYDAEPEVAQALLAGKPLQLTRAGLVSRRTPRTTRADALPEDEANLVFEAMLSKYGDRVAAADIYYLMLGRSRDRVAVVAYLVDDQGSRP